MAKKQTKTNKTRQNKQKKQIKESKTTKETSKNQTDSNKNIVFELKLIIIFLLSITLAMSIHGFPMGIVGEAVRNLLSGLFSVSMYFIPYFLMAFVLIFSIGKFRKAKLRYVFSLITLFFTQLLFVGFYTRRNIVPIGFTFNDISQAYINGNKLIGSGLLGNLIFVPFYNLLGDSGTILIIITFSLVFLLLASKFTFSGMISIFGKYIKKTSEKAIEKSKRIGSSISDSSTFIKDEYSEESTEKYDDYENFSVIKSAVGKDKIKKSTKEENSLIDVEFLEELGGFGEFDYEEAVRKNQELEKNIYPKANLLAEGKNSEFKFINIIGDAEKHKNLENSEVSEELGLNKNYQFKNNLNNDIDTEFDDESLIMDIKPDNQDSSVDDLEESVNQKPEEAFDQKTIEDLQTKNVKIKDDKEITINNTDNPAKIEVVDTDYVLPSVDILIKGASGTNAENERDIVSKAAILEETFTSFKVDAKVTSAVQGPMITRFEVKPNAGVKISKIASLSDDIAMRLAATNVRILAPIPGKSAVGIEVPNDTVSIVRLRDVLEAKAYDNNKSKIKFGLGKDISGEEIVADLAKMPHLLIAGATGSGKSVCVNTIISSILFNAKPSEVKFLMIDPKVVELSIYNGIPHLLLPVVTDPSKASIALNWAVNEMTQRYAKFAEFKVRDISSYNEKYKEWKQQKEESEIAENDLRENGILDDDNLNSEEFNPDNEENIVYKVVNEEVQENTMEFMPRIVVIIDELADLMVVAGKQVEESIARLAQMARAAGMHLIVATQRPSVDVITGLIKANIPSRIAFAVSSQIDSRTILDEQGADKLLGKGDMLFLNAGKSKPTRVQGAFITDSEVENLVNYVKNQFDGELEYNEAVVDSSNVKGLAGTGSEDVDELLDAAIKFVIQSEKASTSMIQRKFRIGYNRAARMVEEMEERGVVGPSRGAKPREVLISSQVWEGENDEPKQT